MKKATGGLIVSIIALFITIIPVFGQAINNQAPQVPPDVAVKGRQAVVSYLGRTVTSVLVRFKGDSIGVETERYLDLQELQGLGYTTPGSFAELFGAIAGVPFSQEVIPTPNGYFDVRVEVSINSVSRNGEASSFTGGGWLNITRGEDGKLSAGEFNPWVSLCPDIAVVVPSGWVVAAKWIGDSGEAPQYLPFVSASPDSISALDLILPTRLLERGHIVLMDMSGGLRAFNLRSGDVIAGEEVFALLGRLNSGDIRPLQNPGFIDAGDTSFVLDWGRMYGRFPLLDIVWEGNAEGSFYFEVPVWGGPDGVQKVAPSRAFLTPLDSLGGVAQERELPQAKGGGWLISVPAGHYHLRMEFDGLLDWDAYPGGKG